MSETKVKDQKNNTVQELKSLFYVILIALLIRTFIIELFYVPTGSMKFTILEGDYIFSTKYSYGYSNYSFPLSPNLFKGRIFAAEPTRGDIIIFRPPMKMDTRYVKRLIGLPGDKIQIINDIIYINDRPINREFIGEFINKNGHTCKKYKETLPNGFSYIAYKGGKSDSIHNSTTEVFYVPQGKYFFVGDNRDDSDDSRFNLGFVPFENFIAKGQFILFSTKEQFWQENLSIIEQIKRVGIWATSFTIKRSGRSIYSLDLNATDK